MSAETPNKQTKRDRSPRPSARSRTGMRFRQPSVHEGPQIHLQHAAWADAIRTKFLPTKLLGVHPETYIFLHIAGGRRLLLRERRLMQQFVLPLHATLLHQIQWKEAPVPRLLQAQQPGTPFAPANQSLTFRETGRAGVALPGRDKQVPGASPHHASLHPGNGLSAPVVQLLPKNLSFRTVTAQEDPLERESSPSKIARRIVGRLQRVETGAIPQQSARERKHTAAPPGDVAWIKPTPTAAASRRHMEQEERRPAKEQAPAPPVINVAQITESVLQQLDRRLTAARERMGKI